MLIRRLMDSRVRGNLLKSISSLDKSYYYLGKVYEMQGIEDFATAFHEMAVRVNPQLEAAEKQSEK